MMKNLRKENCTEEGNNKKRYGLYTSANLL